MDHDDELVKLGMIADSLLDTLITVATVYPKTFEESAMMFLETPVGPGGSRDVYLAALLATALNRLASQ